MRKLLLLLRVWHWPLSWAPLGAMGYILKPEYCKDDVVYPHAEYLTSVSAGPEADPLIMQTLKVMLVTQSQHRK